MLVAFHKPYGVLSQFSENNSKWNTLADFGFPKEIYPIGRLDADSEGLLLLSDESQWNQELLHPRSKHWREYWVQVEGVPNEKALKTLEKGVVIQGKKTLPAQAKYIEPQPDIEPRDPPIRYRKNIPDTWISLSLREGRNRQVRRMTASVGHPTLRLIRVGIGKLNLWRIKDLGGGKWKKLGEREKELVKG